MTKRAQIAGSLSNSASWPKNSFWPVTSFGLVRRIGWGVEQYQALGGDQVAEFGYLAVTAEDGVGFGQRAGTDEWVWHGQSYLGRKRRMK